MKSFRSILALCIVLAVIGCDASKTPKGESVQEKTSASDWRQEFDMASRDLVSTGTNPYFILEPDFELVFESKDEKLVITVLHDTVEVGGIMTRVVEEREWENGELKEVSRNFFAIDKNTRDVFYFGEAVDDYTDGKITGHSGGWRADDANAKPGLIMPGAPTAGMKYYQEIAPGIAMDRAEVISLGGNFETPAGAFDSCLKIQEGSALKTGEKEFKMYARGVGLLQDEDMLLVKYGFIRK